MKTNYHTHTPRCLHATGSEREYARRALENGYGELGFADHCPWNYGRDFVSNMRMEPGELKDYARSVRALEEEYQGKLKIRLGLECEYFPSRMNWLMEQKERHQLDYLILGNHFDTDEPKGMYFGACRTPRDMNRYVNMTIAGMETGYFAYLAHPDLFLRTMARFTPEAEQASRALCRAAVQLNMPLEYNLNGLLYYKGFAGTELGYPCRAFWEIAAQEGAQAIVGVDAHSPDILANDALYVEAVRTLDALGMKRLERLDMDAAAKGKC